MKRRLFLHLWLAVLFLLAQQGAFAHAVSHLQEDLFQPSHHGKQLPHNDVCPQCAAFGHMGSAVSPSFLMVPASTGAFACMTVLFTPVPGTAFHSYHSRAPPLLSSRE